MSVVSKKPMVLPLPPEDVGEECFPVEEEVFAEE